MNNVPFLDIRSTVHHNARQLFLTTTLFQDPHFEVGVPTVCKDQNVTQFKFISIGKFCPPWSKNQLIMFPGNLNTINITIWDF
jgi:hypothetical protein